MDLVDEIIVTDDASDDETVAEAKRLGLRTLVHPQNRGYGGNQKTCYQEALRLGADVVVMLHPDYQYTPKLLPAMIGLLTDGPYDAVLGSRILGGGALRGGMPRYKYVANRFLTATQNLLSGAKLSEYHTGYRAFTRSVLEELPLLENSDDFVFDNQMLAQILNMRFPDRRDQLPDSLLRRGLIHQFQPFSNLRHRRIRHVVPALPTQKGNRELRHFRG